MVPVPVPLVVSVSVYGPFSVNCASTFLCPFISRFCGVVVPVRSPVNPVNVLPVLAFAHMVTVVP